MARRSRALFEAIHTEGGLLPPDLLKRIAEGDKELPGLAPADYHLFEGERIKEAASRAWNRVLGAWASFREACEKLGANAPDAGITRERWLAILFQELGYGRLEATPRATELGGKAYPISHFWQRSPIHLVGFRTDLDTRTKGVAGAARQSPHSLVQEFLNRSDEHLWGVVSNGIRLRLLRDNVSLTRQAYVEFDLEAMMEGEAYADFALLWIVAHESRLEPRSAAAGSPARPEGCWLEAWVRAAQEQGTRALDQLRGGVEKAIAALGRGFLAHPANAALREALRTGELTAQDYYRELLRLVYRLLFLFTAEDRGLLLLPEPGTKPEARRRYLDHYSAQRLRRLAERRRGGPHPDLYRGLRLVMAKLGDDRGCPELALPALGSFLWSENALPYLANADLSNRHLLEAVRALAFTEDQRRLRPVDYRNLGSEELGSIYESLLELHPEVDTGAAHFELRTAAGHERKTTGSYYTPASLIQCLLEIALDPTLDEAQAKPDPEAALLALKVCDPACGSGHFLIAAAHRIARRLASTRTGEEEPAPEALRTALRDVIGRCLYGVDVNPMAVELCKVSLWLEALEPGKPLSFLDHHVQCGNSLLGTTPALLAQGIPDDAFKAIEGDDKRVAAAFRQQNREEKRGQSSLFTEFARDAAPAYSTMADAIDQLAREPDDSLATVHRKEKRYRSLAGSAEWRAAKLLADAWCAAFLARKTASAGEGITEDVFRRLSKAPASTPAAIVEEIDALSQHYRLLHWHLAFPEVFRLDGPGQARRTEHGWSGGFDLVLGNPPWDALSPDMKEFFSSYDPEVRFQDADGQRRIIELLLEDSSIAASWAEYRRDLYAAVHFFKNSGRYRLFAPGNLGKGDFNVFRMFVETALQTLAPAGRAAQVVPEGFYNGANCMAIRKALFEEYRLSRVLGFENTREVWFKGIDSRAKFAVYCAEYPGFTERVTAGFNIREPARLAEVMAGGSLAIPVSLIREFSPDALAMMEFRSQRDIDIASKMYERWPKFGDETAGPPYRGYMREIDMGNDRDLFSEDPAGLPLYEGRMVGQYDHRAKGYRSGRGRAAVWEELPFGDPSKSIQPQWWIARGRVPAKCSATVGRYRIGYCPIASPTNERSLVACLLPADSVAGHSVFVIGFAVGCEWAYLPWLAVANSFTMDFLARKKVSLNMTFTIMDSLPFPRLGQDDPRVTQLAPFVLRLICTGPEMTALWNAMAPHGWVEAVPEDGPPPGLTDESSRLEAVALIEAIVARDLFGLSREELDFVLETFPIVKRRDEAAYGEYRTKRLILEAYDLPPEQRSVPGAKSAGDRL